MKTPEEAMDLIENMAASNIAILRDKAHIPTKKSLLELTSHDALLAQNKLLSKQLEALTKQNLGCTDTEIKVFYYFIWVIQLARMETVILGKCTFSARMQLL